jgi:hypothetical protein
VRGWKREEGERKEEGREEEEGVQNREELTKNLLKGANKNKASTSSNMATRMF